MWVGGWVRGLGGEWTWVGGCWVGARVALRMRGTCLPRGAARTCVWWSTCSRQPAAAAAASPEWVRCGRPPAWVLTRARLKPVRPVVVTEIGIARRARVHARREIARARRASRTAHARAHVHATHTHTPTRPRTRATRNQIRSDQITRKQLSKYLQLELPIELPLIRLHTQRRTQTDTETTSLYRSNPPRTAFFQNSF